MKDASARSRVSSSRSRRSAQPAPASSPSRATAAARPRRAPRSPPWPSSPRPGAPATTRTGRRDSSARGAPASVRRRRARPTTHRVARPASAAPPSALAAARPARWSRSWSALRSCRWRDHRRRQTIADLQSHSRHAAVVTRPACPSTHACRQSRCSATKQHQQQLNNLIKQPRPHRDGRGDTLTHHQPATMAREHIWRGQQVLGSDSGWTDGNVRARGAPLACTCTLAEAAARPSPRSPAPNKQELRAGHAWTPTPGRAPARSCAPCSPVAEPKPHPGSMATQPAAHPVVSQSRTMPWLLLSASR